ADLRRDRRDRAMSGEAIAPGHREKSALVERIYSAEKSEVMPPAKTKKSLTDAQKAILKQWIAEGAEYQPHWSLIPPARPALPPVKNEAWVNNPIDRFVLAKLEAAGPTPPPPAARRPLARRRAPAPPPPPPAPPPLAHPP